MHAHRQWMLPSSTVLSNTDAWVTVDAAVSNGLFYFDHVPMRLTSLRITGPDGLERKPQNAATGKYRSTFDVHLNGAGTYKIAIVQSTVFATWDDAGQQKSWRGSASDFAAQVPPAAAGLKTSKMNSRLETFVTAGKPSNKVFETTGVGLELVPVTHPNDLVTGEAATFQLLLDGKPAAGLEVTLIAGASRYRDKEDEMKAKTGEDGKFSVTFKDPGMYWMNATTAPARGGGPAAGGPKPAIAGGPGAGGPGAGGPMRMPVGDRSSYTATFEVLPQ
ncbi:MAG: DUF4198 domain-containing protein [Bryobacteraceae bacterium]|nr:DUF4198 domain-containing protein [Bryobacteraceae bacterium]